MNFTVQGHIDRGTLGTFSYNLCCNPNQYNHHITAHMLTANHTKGKPISSINAIRQAMRKRRRAIGIGAQKRAAYQLATSLNHLSIYKRSQHIAFYLSADGEIDLGFAMKTAWSQGKTCYLPVVDGGELLFVQYTPTTSLIKNTFGILEPASGGIISPYHLDLVLAPLVAFDQHYHRIGMGGGFYDKTFANHHLSKTFLMGVAHRCQRVNRIPVQPWDVALHRVLTN